MWIDGKIVGNLDTLPFPVVEIITIATNYNNSRPVSIQFVIEGGSVHSISQVGTNYSSMKMTSEANGFVIIQNMGGLISPEGPAMIQVMLETGNSVMVVYYNE